MSAARYADRSSIRTPIPETYIEVTIVFKNTNPAADQVA